MRKVLLFLALGIAVMAKTQTIVFAAGCFWGVEKHFEHLDGVKSATSGYAGGNYDNPDYKKVLAHRKSKKNVINYAESVKVVYDDSKISTKSLIKSFWELHDPTQGNRQGNDRGDNYRSALYYTTDRQKEIALSTKKIYQKLLNKAGYGTITTEIKPLKKFYPAENYHQDYLEKNPFGYCPNHATGVKFGKQKAATGTILPLGGKEIVVIDALHCRFCEKFKKNVTDYYNGTLPLRTVHQNALKGFTLNTKIEGTPTILFIKDGREVESFVGYMDEKAFYKAVGAFKLGKDSEGYDVAFRKSTDGRFCKKYDEFKHTGDGVFRDKISGDILFDTRDRFNSGSGWLSFFKAVDGATVQKEDNSFGMHRVEIIAKKSGAHLGHVFNDAPGGRQRFCINATILEFVPRDHIKKQLKK
ncbi:peptide-methionine (S)-S-oxide reductase MsrA [Sulfurovum sp.]|uniref:peptide-methionine (S)-S-oxide reductase MsrA n=1 Tax=Sulfurovum sp. TaxID=1969726 RepID=UPI0025FABDEE|nr:peptide-methionine (S)-S-oxide reductase MsrA [Sulfurovum sp.]